MGSKSALTLPKLRFKGFDGEWVWKKLGNICKVKRGSSPRPIFYKGYFSKNSNCGWLRINDVKELFLHSTTEFLSEEGMLKTTIVEKNNLIMSICGTLGKLFINKIKVGLPDSFVVFKDLSENKFFILYYLSNYDFEKKLGQHGSQFNLNTSLISNLPISIPSLPEQQKIAHFFSLLDKQIQLWERKLELYELKKKYFVKKQLSIYITKYKSEKIKNFFNLIIGASLENSVTENGKFYLIDLSSINLKNQLIKNFKKTNDSLNILKRGDIVIIMSDVSHKQLIGRSAIITENNLFSLNQRVGALRKNKIVSENFSKFISIILNAERKYFYNIAQGSSQTNISNKNILDFSFPLPSVNVIESFVRTIIQLENYELFLNNKITLLKKRKKFYINKLFM